MKRAFERHLKNVKAGKVLEVGSASVTAPFRQIFEQAGWSYVGADLASRPNVDLVLEDPFLWDIPSNSFGAILSGQMLEHNEMFWLSFIEMARVLAPGGVMIHIAPSRGPEHRAPQDCWRFYRDGMLALAKWTGLECLEASTDWARADIDWIRQKKPARFKAMRLDSQFPAGRWGDTVGVFRKPSNARPDLAIRYMKDLIAKWDDQQ
jgi:SAM-dependent methyltransferase